MDITRIELNHQDYKVVETKVMEELNESCSLKVNNHAETFSFEFNKMPYLDESHKIEFDFTFKGHYDDGELWMSEPSLNIFCNGSEIETTEVNYSNWLQSFLKKIEKELSYILI